MRLAPFIILQKNRDGSGILLNPASYRGITLNRTGSFICSALEREVEIAAVITAFAAEFQVETVVAERDVKAFVKLLQEKGLVRG